MNAMAHIVPTTHLGDGFRENVQRGGLGQRWFWSFFHLYNESSIKRSPSDNPTTWEKKEDCRSWIVLFDGRENLDLSKARTTLTFSGAEHRLETSASFSSSTNICFILMCLQVEPKHIDMTLRWHDKLLMRSPLSFRGISLSLVSCVTLGDDLISLSPSFLFCKIKLVDMISRVILLP